MTKVSSKIQNTSKEVALNTSSFWLQTYLHVFAELNKQVDTKQLDVEIPETLNYLNEVGTKVSKIREVNKNNNKKDNKESAYVPSTAEVVVNFYEKLAKDVGVEGLADKNQNGNSGDDNDKRNVDDKPVFGKQSQAIQELLTKVKKSNFTALLNAESRGINDVLVQLRKLARAVAAAKQKPLIYSQLIEMDMEQCLGASSSRLEGILNTGTWRERFEAFADETACFLTGDGFLSKRAQIHYKTYLLRKLLLCSDKDAFVRDDNLFAASVRLTAVSELEVLKGFMSCIAKLTKQDIAGNVADYNRHSKLFQKGRQEADKQSMADANKKLSPFRGWQAESLEDSTLVSLSKDGFSMKFNTKLFDELLPCDSKKPESLDSYVNMSSDDIAGLDVLECALVGAYLSDSNSVLGVPLVSKKYLESALEKLSKIKEGLDLDAKAKQDGNVASDNGLPSVFGEGSGVIEAFEERLKQRLELVNSLLEAGEVLWKPMKDKDEVDPTGLALCALYEGKTDSEVKSLLKGTKSCDYIDFQAEESVDGYITTLMLNHQTFINNWLDVSVLALALAQRRGQIVTDILYDLSKSYRFVDYMGQPSRFLFDLSVASVIQRNDGVIRWIACNIPDKSIRLLLKKQVSFVNGSKMGVLWGCAASMGLLSVIDPFLYRLGQVNYPMAGFYRRLGTVNHVMAGLRVLVTCENLSAVRKIEELKFLMESRYSDSFEYVHFSALLADACVLGEFEVAKWLYKKGGTICVDICSAMVARGRLDMLKACLEEGIVTQKMLQARNADGRTPLIEAYLHGKFELAEWLKEKGCKFDVLDFVKHNICYLMVQSGDLKQLKVLCDKKLLTQKMLEARGAGGRTPLMEACLHRNFELAEWLKEKGCRLDVVGSVKNNICHLVAQSGDLKQLKVLSDKELLTQKMLQARNADGRTPLMEACLHGKPEVVEWLYKKKGCRRDVVDFGENNICHLMAQNGDLEQLKVLSDKKLLTQKMLQARNADGRTPLMEAYRNRQFEVAEWFKEMGCKLGVTDKYGNNICHIIAQNGDLERLKKEEVSKLLLDGKQEFDSGKKSVSVITMVFDLIDKEVSADKKVSKEKALQSQNKSGKTPLVIACEEGHFEIVKWLLEEENVYNLSKEKSSEWPDCIPHYLAANGYIDELKKMSDERVLYEKDAKGRNPFFVACLNHKFDVAEWLVEKGGFCIIHMDDKDWNNIYHFLDAEILKFMKDLLGKFDEDKRGTDKERGKMLLAKNTYGRTPLMEACKRGCVDIIDFEGFCGPDHIDKMMVDMDGNNITHYLAQCGVLDFFERYFLKNRSTYEMLEKNNIDGKSPLDIAKNSGHTDIVNWMEDVRSRYSKGAHSARPNVYMVNVNCFPLEHLHQLQL